MFDSILKWIAFQIMDKKRITAALIAGLNLIVPWVEKLGVEVPQEGLIQLASFGAIMLLAGASKLNARKAENPS
jgi:hypothetical protein